MAGICGIIVSEKTDEGYDYSHCLQLMLGKLAGSTSQPAHSEIFENFYFGNASVISDTKNKNFICNQELDIYCSIDGLVFLTDEAKDLISKNYTLNPGMEDKKYLPYLYEYYGMDLIKQITGWYNIFLFDKKSKQGLLFNDRLGYLPLFFYESSSHFIFASKIESILASGLLASIEFDIVSFAEHLFFNYIISDHTYVKNINTLSYATLVQIDRNGMINKDNYWTLSKLFTDEPVRKKEGIDLLDDGIKKALNKLLKNNINSLAVSLTGGLDSRIVLSYLMSFKDRLHLYSFGQPDSNDIIVPGNLTSNENILYTPYLLDEQYLSRDFIRCAKNTILNSNGTRNYKRSHYLYAIEQISSFSDITISGIFGDEVLKISGVKPNNVISKNSIDFIASNFDLELMTTKFKSSKLWYYLNFLPEYTNEFEKRMMIINQDASKYNTINKKCYHYRFLIILRKYFGAEVNSYNDFCYSFSPFIDFDFLSAYFHSYLCGVYYPFNNNSLLLKIQSIKLYSELVNRNCKHLLYYPTDKGYSMADSFRIPGIIKIMSNRFAKRRGTSDTYNTIKTNSLFSTVLKNDHTVIQPNLFPLNRTCILKDDDSEMMSLYYWALHIYTNYFDR